jgi:cytochrome c oxidase subunit 2
MSFTAEAPAVISSAATTTEAVDPVFLFIFGIALVMLLGITAVMIFFTVKYNRKRHPHPTSERRYNIPLEIAWTVIPSILVLAMFYYGWAGYLALRNVPEGAMEVSVTGRMWSWTFTYDIGRTSDRLYVPAGKPVRVEIHSEDVLHSFYIPAFRIKRDAVPGMSNYVWFVAPAPGSYDIFCAEYCGQGHSSMITTVEALTPHEFEEWTRQESAAEEEGEGEALLTAYGCLGCHSLDGSAKVGPTLQGIFGRSVTVLAGGEERTLVADTAYLRRAILEPAAEVVKGFPPVMPSYAGRISDHELEEILEYFETRP